MRDPAVRAELYKLANILDTDVDSIDYLSYLEADRLRVLRSGVSDALFERFRPTFRGFARLSTMLPAAIAARLSQHVLGPMLAGRIAGEMPPDKGIELSGRLPDEMLADTCLHIDPSRTEPIIRGFPVDRAVAITRILLARRELITMARLVDVLPDETLFATTDAIQAEADLLQISFFVEDATRLDQVVQYLDIDRREALVQAAAREQLWPEVMATLLRVDATLRRQLTEIALAQSQDVLDSLIRAAASEDLWPALLSIAAEMPGEIITRLSEQPAFEDRAVARSVIDSVVVNDLWSDFRTQLPHMANDRLAVLIAVAGEERAAFLQELDRRIDASDPGLAALADASARLSAEQRAKAADACGDGPLGQRLAAG